MYVLILLIANDSFSVPLLSAALSDSHDHSKRVFFMAGTRAWANFQAEAALDVRLLRINAELERKGYLVRVAFAKQRCTSWIEFHTSKVPIGNFTAD